MIQVQQLLQIILRFCNLEETLISGETFLCTLQGLDLKGVVSFLIYPSRRDGERGQTAIGSQSHRGEHCPRGLGGLLLQRHLPRR